MKGALRRPDSCEIRHVALLLARAILAGAAAAGCCGDPPKDPCVPGGEPGREYEVTLDELYTDTPTRVSDIPSCEGGDGLGPGSAFSFSILNQGYFEDEVKEGVGCPKGCWRYGAAVTFPSDVVVIGNSEGGGFGAVEGVLAQAAKVVDMAGCQAKMTLLFQRGLVTRLLQIDAPVDAGNSCPMFDSGALFGGNACGDAWLATLTSR